MSYEIEYEPDAREDLAWLPRHQQVLVLAEVQRLLADQPTAQSKKRRPMRPNPHLASWELRLGRLRVYYDAVDVPARKVRILRIGEKVREQVRIRGEYVRMTL